MQTKQDCVFGMQIGLIIFDRLRVGPKLKLKLRLRLIVRLRPKLKVELKPELIGTSVTLPFLLACAHFRSYSDHANKELSIQAKLNDET